MSKNLGTFDRVARIIGGSIFLVLSIIVFKHPVAQLLAILFGLWGVLEGISGACPLYFHLGMKKPAPWKPETVLELAVVGIQTAIGYVWWSSGWMKIKDATLIATLPKQLAAFALHNPYPFMQRFLLGNATQYANVYGFLVVFGEYLIGIVLIALAYAWLTAHSDSSRKAALYVSVVALGIGAFLNAIFYFSSAHLGEAVRYLNVLMFWTELSLFYGYVHLLIQKPPRFGRR